MIQKGIVPFAFLLSFGLLFLCDRISDRLAGPAVLVFGFGWLFAVVWWGML